MPPTYEALPALAAPTVAHAVVGQRDVALISLRPAAGVGAVDRCPVDVVCVIDLSGSMDESATLAGAQSESAGLTILDVVKHAVRTIIASLSDNDRLSLVSFSDGAKVELAMMPMSAIGKESANKTIERLVTTGSTNIWAGLDQALDVVNTSIKADTRLSAVLLFTDGQPNIRPPGGEIAMLEKRRKNKYNGRLPAIVNTFGFGYNLDSVLLNEIAEMGEGSFAFIPDASFVGTVFVDAASNILAAMAKHVKIIIEPLNGTEIQLSADRRLPGGHRVLSADDPSASLASLTLDDSKAPLPANAVVLTLGTLQAVQTKDVAVTLSRLPAPGTPYLRARVLFENVRGGGVGGAAVEATARNWEPAEVACQHFRLLAVERIRAGWEAASKGNTHETPASHVESLIADIKKALPKLNNDARVNSLLEDLEGQVLEALRPDYFAKWGRHYLLSLAGAHLQQQCNNFKDPGVQVYQGPLFTRLRDELTELFITLPAPTPTGRVYNGGGGNARPSRLANMAAYHNASAGCFAVDSPVETPAGPRAAGSLRRGDVVLTPQGPATVRCLLRSRAPGALIRLPSGLTLTPRHPVRLTPTSDWVHPCNVPGAQPAQERPVVSVLLDATASGRRPTAVLIRGAEVAALAHGLEGPVVAHEFFGTEAVVDAMRGMDGWARGDVAVAGALRDRETGWIVGLVPEPSARPERVDTPAPTLAVTCA